MSIINYWKNLKNFSIIILPDDTSHKTKSRKINVATVLLALTLYTVVVAIIGFTFFHITGIGNLIMPSQSKLRPEDVRTVETLNEKILFAKELQSLKSTNEKLKYALILGDSSLSDSINLDDTSGFEIPAEGNILKALSHLLTDVDQDDPEDIIFISPATGFVSKRFDEKKAHFGMDIVLKEGTPVFASASGFVIFADYTIDFGYIVILNHGDGFITVYKHCSSLLKRERERVEQGEIIALSGNSGTKSTGPHLHFEIWKDGIALNPEKILINY